MLLQVTGKQIDVGDALRGHVDQQIKAVVEKYFDRAIDGTVVFSRQGNFFRCDCSVHFGAGLESQAQGEAAEIYASFDQALERLEKRLRRYKRRLRDHHAKARSERLEISPARAYVLAGAGEEAEEPRELNPIVVAETKTEISTLTVGEAVMRLDLGEQPALIFRNSAHGGLNVVYRRTDGNIGWIDPQGSSR
ncbi:MAG: ribosome-associated translation inhibitor RaiA [Alphaproteobacteria bacterium]|nr:ribosome-associated translation inhibitor RaiA [Alphaproteobacteria bacterium]